jgi:hypothetical protein
VRRLAVLLVLALGLTVVATALARSTRSAVRSSSVVTLQSGCLRDRVVTVRIKAPSGDALSPLRVRANGREIVHLTGVTGSASVRLRLPAIGGHVTVDGETLGGDHVAASRLYRPCTPPAATPQPQAQPRPRPRPQPPVTGGGEG